MDNKSSPGGDDITQESEKKGGPGTDVIVYVVLKYNEVLHLNRLTLPLYCSPHTILLIIYPGFVLQSISYKNGYYVSRSLFLVSRTSVQVLGNLSHKLKQPDAWLLGTPVVSVMRLLAHG